jgi:predicted nucleotidyltransferase
LVGLKLALEDLLGRKVDVVNYDCMRNNLLREAVESKAVDFYAA